MTAPARKRSDSRLLGPALACLPLLVAACASSSNATSQEPNVGKEEMKVTVKGADATREGDTLKIQYPVLQDKNDRLPDWVINPAMGGVIGAVGVASMKLMGTRQQIDEARKSARLEIAAMLEARVQQVGREELEENMRVAGGAKTEQSRNTNLRIGRDILDTVLAGTRQRGLWFDPENEECYVWMVLDGRVLSVADHHVVDSVSVFVANTPITQEYRPERRKPVVPTVIVEQAQQAQPTPVPEPPKTETEKLEGNLKPITTIPIKGDGTEGQKSAGK